MLEWIASLRNDQRTTQHPMATPDLETIYEDLILDHFNSPYHRGQLDGATHTHTIRNPLCGDQLRLDLLINERQQIAQAFFDAKGCVISQAAASILCQHVEGKTAGALSTMTPDEMLALLRIPLSPGRKQCGLLAFSALQTILRSAASAL